MSKHIDTKHKIQELDGIETFQNLLDQAILTDEDRELMRLIYLKEETQVAISQKLGMSVSTVKRRHAKILKKLSKLV